MIYGVTYATVRQRERKKGERRYENKGCLRKKDVLYVYVPNAKLPGR